MFPRGEAVIWVTGTSVFMMQYSSLGKLMTAMLDCEGASSTVTWEGVPQQIRKGAGKRGSGGGNNANEDCVDGAGLGTMRDTGGMAREDGGRVRGTDSRTVAESSLDRFCAGLHPMRARRGTPKRGRKTSSDRGSESNDVRVLMCIRNRPLRICVRKSCSYEPRNTLRS